MSPAAHEMTTVMLGVGEMAATRRPGVHLHASGLGSCVALVLFDQASKTVGMAHVALPYSQANESRGQKLPGYFADTGVPALLERMAESGAARNVRNYVVKLVGGARVMDPERIFNIGQKNVEALRGLLRQHGLKPVAEEVGGSISRTVRVSVDNGAASVSVSSPGRGTWCV